MRVSIPNLSPLATEWQDGRNLVASSWRAVDSVDQFGEKVRRVWHYNTLMCEFVAQNDDATEWWCGVLSVGHGSVSDQQGMNTLLRSVGSPLLMFRDGRNPRYSTTPIGLPVAVRG